MTVLEEYNTSSPNQTVQSKKNYKILCDNQKFKLSNALHAFYAIVIYPSVEIPQHRLKKNFFSEILYTYTSGMRAPETSGFMVFCL